MSAIYNHLTMELRPAQMALHIMFERRHVIIGRRVYTG